MQKGGDCSNLADPVSTLLMYAILDFCTAWSMPAANAGHIAEQIEAGFTVTHRFKTQIMLNADYAALAQPFNIAQQIQAILLLVQLIADRVVGPPSHALGLGALGSRGRGQGTAPWTSGRS